MNNVRPEALQSINQSINQSIDHWISIRRIKFIDIDVNLLTHVNTGRSIYDSLRVGGSEEPTRDTNDDNVNK